MFIVVDHASGDGSAERIREAYPSVEVVETEANSGPSGGMNHIFRAGLRTDADAVLTVTDDALPAPDALQRLLDRLEGESAVGAVCPLTVAFDAPNRVADAGGYVVPGKWHFYPRREPEEAELWEGVPPITIDYTQFGFTLIRAEAARSVMPFVELFFHWGEEAEFSTRLRQAGWRIECVPAARSRQHFTQQPSPYLVQRNSLEVVRRHAPKRLLARELVRAIWFSARDAAQTGSRDRRRDGLARARGVADFALRRFGPAPKTTTRKG
jgi:GT2 family glycosyltransferase